MNISKSEMVRVELKDADYLKFNELNTRLIFEDKELNDRKSREETFKFSLRFTSLAIKTLLNNPNSSLFIQDNESDLMYRLEEHLIAESKSSLIEQNEQNLSAFNAAINFAIEISAGNEGAGITFLKLWREGEFDQIRQEFPTFGPLPS